LQHGIVRDHWDLNLRLTGLAACNAALLVLGQQAHEEVPIGLLLHQKSLEQNLGSPLLSLLLESGLEKIILHYIT